MTGDAELMSGDPRWHNFLPGTSPLGLFFTGVEASGALSRDVKYSFETYLSCKKSMKEWSNENNFNIERCTMDYFY